MTYVLVKHKIEDWDAWKPVFDSHKPTRISGGELDSHVYRTDGNPNEITVLFKWDSLKKAKAFLESKDLKTKMAEGGVTGEPEIRFLNEVETMAS